MGTVGQGFMDVLTLGQTVQARKSARQQEAMLNNMRDQQAAQMAELQKQGPAPTVQTPDQVDSEDTRRKRLEALRAGLASTMKAPSGLATNDPSISTPSLKSKLGG